MTDLKRRAGIFAALADQTRLRMVDLLTLGDLSSSEIGAQLGLRSNLVAHHLGVLESARIIARARSEFDQRRSYIGLRPRSSTRSLPRACRPRSASCSSAPRTPLDRSSPKSSGRT